MPRTSTSRAPKKSRSSAPSEYAGYLAQIDELQRKAEQERSGVIARIREAVAYYSLTPDELFGQVKTGRKKVSESNRAKKGKPPAPAKKTSAAPKYSDGTNHWSGRGPVPRWLKAALDDGKQRDDFLIKK